MDNLPNEQIDYSRHLQSNIYVCDFKFKDNYKFVNKNIFFKGLSYFLYIVAYIILWPVTKIMYGLKVKGKKNLKGVKNAIFVSNHILELDMVSLLCHGLFLKKPYILCLNETFKIPVVRRLIKLFGAIPLPTDAKSSKNFLKQTDEMLKKGGSLIVFAEGSMWPYYNEIRPFKDGAFRFSIKNDVPVVPICITLREPNKFYKMFGRRKPLATINILPKIEVKEDLSRKELETKLKDQTFNTMSEFFKLNSTDTGYMSKSVKKYLDSIKNSHDNK